MAVKDLKQLVILGILRTVINQQGVSFDDFCLVFNLSADGSSTLALTHVIHIDVLLVNV
jgi:hypothetical protein